MRRASAPTLHPENIVRLESFEQGLSRGGCTMTPTSSLYARGSL